MSGKYPKYPHEVTLSSIKSGRYSLMKVSNPAIRVKSDARNIQSFHHASSLEGPHSAIVRLCSQGIEAPLTDSRTRRELRTYSQTRIIVRLVRREFLIPLSFHSLDL